MLVNRTEQGLPGHFICARDCLFRRNTLLRHNGIEIIVSTVGRYSNQLLEGEFQHVGCGRYYETMVFHAENKMADVSREVDFDSSCSISELSEESDDLANIMHENVVGEITSRLLMDEFLNRGKEEKDSCPFCSRVNCMGGCFK